MTSKLNHENGKPFRASKVFVISFLGFSARTARDTRLRNCFGKLIGKSSFRREKVGLGEAEFPLLVLCFHQLLRENPCRGRRITGQLAPQFSFPLLSSKGDYRLLVPCIPTQADTSFCTRPQKSSNVRHNLYEDTKTVTL